MADNDLRLVTLGRLTLLSADGSVEPSIGTLRRKLTLLAILALARRSLRRDVLAAMLWGEQEEARARHSLTDALSHVRRVLGPASLATHQSEIALGADASVCTDVQELVRAAARGDYARVVELYGGPFLDGMDGTGSHELDRWILGERERVRGLFAEACELHCGALAAAGRWQECAGVAERWLEADATSADAACCLLGALRSVGTAEALRRALVAYRQIADRLAVDYDWVPDARVAALETQIAGDLERMAVSVPQKLVASAVAVGRGRPRALVAAMILLVLGGAGIVAMRRQDAAPRSSTAVVAVMGIRDLSGDGADQWLEQGLAQMIVADLYRVTGMDVVTPERVRAVEERAQLGRELDLLPSQMLEVGRRVGATSIVSGGFTHGGGRYVLSLTVRDASAARAPRLFTVSDTSVMSLVDAAAARVADAVDAGAGPRFSDVETSSLEAYQHYMSAVQADEAGRWDRANEELDRALARDSQFVAALALRATLARRDGQLDVEWPAVTAIARAGARASEFDRLSVAAYRSFEAGDRQLAEEGARDLTERFPRDPRAYAIRAEILSGHGRWREEEAVLLRALALDSLGIAAGRGPCMPCVAYGGLVDARYSLGNLDGALAAAARWASLEPDAPAPWRALSAVLSSTGRFADALAAERKAIGLSAGVWDVGLGRIWLMQRRYELVDSAVRVWERSSDPEVRGDAADLGLMLRRELGQYRASGASASDPGASGLRFVAANSMARAGGRGFVHIYEKDGHPRATPGLPAGLTARGFCWAHALEGDALALAGDTTRVRALADSIDAASRRSYYARDWRLAHHLRGVLALRAHRYPEAVRELEAARYSVAGWTRTDAELARAYMGLGNPRAALTVLRQAYAAPLDAMGRYEPRSELDYLMVQAFRAAGEADSAAVYVRYLRRAWGDADPEVKARLGALGR